MFHFPVLYTFFTEALCKLKCVAGSTKKGKKPYKFQEVKLFLLLNHSLTR